MELRRISLVAALLLVSSGCSSPSANEPLPRDASPGTWRTWVIGSPAQIQVPAPPAQGSAQAAAEADELSKLAAERTPEQLATVRNWNEGPAVAPWIELAMERVSARPKDPPASSRAYALVSVAMYDAVVAASYWKGEFQRSGPVVDPIVPVEPDSAYPSEHAAIAGAASSVLEYLFPEYPAARFRLMAEDAAGSRIIAGVDVRSDVEAGLELGRAVAAQVIDRARADGYDTEWDGARPKGRGFWAPPPGSVARPTEPMAGTWRPWVLTSGDQVRPGPPPAFDSPEFLSEAKQVMDIGDTLTDEQRKIAEFWAGSEGTPLPAGIWNGVVLEYLRPLGPSDAQGARVMALVNVAMADGGVAAWDAKFTYWGPRPENAIRDLGLDRGWEPLLATPFFPGYVSGHAVYSGAASEVLAYLFPEDADMFREEAEEAAWSRILGGIHFASDSEVGIEMGREIGRLVVERARGDGSEG